MAQKLMRLHRARAFTVPHEVQENKSTIKLFASASPMLAKRAWYNATSTMFLAIMAPSQPCPGILRSNQYSWVRVIHVKAGLCLLSLWKCTSGIRQDRKDTDKLLACTIMTFAAPLSVLIYQKKIRSTPSPFGCKILQRTLQKASLKS